MQELIKLISRHLSILVILPCILLALVVTYDVTMSLNRMNDAYETEYNTFLSHHVLSVVHEVQKERGNTAGFLGSNGSKFSSNLTTQRQLTDRVLSRLRQEAKTWSLNEEMEQQLDKFYKQFDDLRSTRNKVDNLTIALPEALSFYTAINSAGLHSVISASRLSNEHEIAAELFAIYNFSAAKESAGIERAILANVIASDRFTPALRNKHVQLMTKQLVYLEEALEASSPNMNAVFRRATESSAAKEVARFREAVSNKDSNFGLDAQQWFKAATDRINKLKDAEEQSLQVIEETSIEIQQHAVIVLVVEAVILVIGALITIALSISIRARHKQSEEMAEGIKFALNDRDLGHEIEILSFDELGEASENVNKLTRKFEEDLIDFGQASKKITTSTHETAVAISQSQQNLIDQQTGIKSIAAATEQMSTNIRVISQSMKDNYESAKQVVTESEGGQIVVTEAVSAIQESAQELEQSAETVDTLNTRVGSISSMVELIRSIADQTNLLALNAAIEAARAGEQGRGFAVVAEEVRNLASRTQESTEQISELVIELQSSSENASKVITLGKDKAMAAAERADQIKGALAKIVDQAKKVEQVTESVTVNTNEQNRALEEVSSNISHIYDKATENVSGAEQIAVAASHIAESAMDMDDMIDRYKVSEVQLFT